MNLYALFDKKADAYSSFSCEKSHAVATRLFASAVMEPKSVLAQYADDFSLVSLIRVPESFAELSKAQSDDAFVWVHEVVVTARQVVDMNSKAAPDGQLSLLKEA